MPERSTNPVATEATHLTRKLMFSVGFIFLSFVYVILKHSDDERAMRAVTASTSPAQMYKQANRQLTQTLTTLTNTPSAPKNPPTTTTAPAPTKPAPTPTPTPTKQSSLYADGSYTGSPADAYYGMVQVEAVIQGGKITDVQFLQHPGGRGTSIYINSQAMPLLTQEAIQAQSAQVNGVSGATETSRAFIESLSSALTKAKNA